MVAFWIGVSHTRSGRGKFRRVVSGKASLMADFSEDGFFLLSTFPSAPSRPTFLTDSEQSEHSSSGSDTTAPPEQPLGESSESGLTSLCWNAFSRLWKKAPLQRERPERRRSGESFCGASSHDERSLARTSRRRSQFADRIRDSPGSFFQPIQGEADESCFLEDASCAAEGRLAFPGSCRSPTASSGETRSRRFLREPRSLPPFRPSGLLEGAVLFHRKPCESGSAYERRFLKAPFVASSFSELLLKRPFGSVCVGGRRFLTCRKQRRRRRLSRIRGKSSGCWSDGGPSRLECFKTPEGGETDAASALHSSPSFADSPSWLASWSLPDSQEGKACTAPAHMAFAGDRLSSQRANVPAPPASGCLDSSFAALALRGTQRASSVVERFSIGFWGRASAVLVLLFLLQLGKGGALLVLLFVSLGCLILRSMKTAVCQVETQGLRSALPPSVRFVLEERRVLDLLQLHLTSGRLGFFLSRLLALSLGRPSHEEALALLEGFPSSAVALLLQRGPVNALPAKIRRLYFGSNSLCEDTGKENGGGERVVATEEACWGSDGAEEECTQRERREEVEGLTDDDGLSPSQSGEPRSDETRGASSKDADAGGSRPRRVQEGPGLSPWSALPLKKHSASEEAVVKKLALSAGDAPWVQVVGNLSEASSVAVEDRRDDCDCENADQPETEGEGAAEREGLPKLLLFYDQQAERPASDVLAAEIVRASDRRVGKFRRRRPGGRSFTLKT